MVKSAEHESSDGEGQNLPPTQPSPSLTTKKEGATDKPPENRDRAKSQSERARSQEPAGAPHEGARSEQKEEERGAPYRTSK